MIEKFIFTKEVLIASAVTLAAVLLNIASKQKRNLLFYFFFFVLMYVFFMGLSLYGEDENGTEFIDIHDENCITNKYFEELSKSLVVENHDGVLFNSFGTSILSLELFTEFVGQNVPSRNELIQKMMFHKNGHDKALNNSKDILKDNKIWNNQVEELYKAAGAAVATYPGARNFLLPAIAAIIEYALDKSWTLLTAWKEYKTEIYQAEYHAEMFDFYMKILKQYYGS